MRLFRPRTVLSPRKVVGEMGLIVRPARIEDAEMLFNWRNDPMTRAMSKNSDDVPWQEHIEWFERRITKPDFYVAQVFGMRFGTVRIDDGKLSYTVAPHWRRFGYGTVMLKWIYDKFGPLIAEIKPENIASIKAATKAGHKVVLL